MMKFEIRKIIRTCGTAALFFEHMCTRVVVVVVSNLNEKSKLVYQESTPLSHCYHSVKRPTIMSRSALWRQEGAKKMREKEAEDLFSMAVEEGRVSCE